MLSNRLHRMWEYFVASQIKASEEFTAPLSSAPCTPAPGRRIIIIRCDNQVAPANLFVSFDRVVPPTPSENTTLCRKSSDSSSSTTDSSSSESQAQPKRKWSILKSMFGMSSNSKSSDAQSNSSDESENQNTDATLTNDKCLEGHPQQRPKTEVIRPKTTHQPFFFKFSLEWADRPQWPTRNRRIFPPSLPAAAQFHLQQRRQPKLPKAEYDTASDGGESKDEETRNDDNREKPAATDEQAAPLPLQQPLPSVQPPSPYPVPKAAAYDKVVASKNVGRALAEWGIIVTECDSFFARRRDEGVPCDRLVETPTLGVEFFRK